MDACEKIFFDKNISIAELGENKNLTFNFFLTFGLEKPEKRKKFVLQIKKMLDDDEFSIFSELYLRERDPETNLLYQYGYLNNISELNAIYSSSVKIGKILLAIGGVNFEI